MFVSTNIQSVNIISSNQYCLSGVNNFSIVVIFVSKGMVLKGKDEIVLLSEDECLTPDLEEVTNLIRVNEIKNLRRNK